LRNRPARHRHSDSKSTPAATAAVTDTSAAV
jgi:hypothetical protein